MPTTQKLIEAALKHQQTTQRGLAAKMGVSHTQISRWKRGIDAHISDARAMELRELAGIYGDISPELFMLAGDEERARQWIEIVRLKIDAAIEWDESGWECLRFEELNENELEDLTTVMLSALQEAGAAVEDICPLEFDLPEMFRRREAEIDYSISEELAANPVCRLIEDWCSAYTDINGYFAAYIEDIIDASDDLYIWWEEETDDLLTLTFIKLEREVLEPVCPAIDQYISVKAEKWRDSLQELFDRAYRERLPIKTDIRNLMKMDIDSCSSEAEEEALLKPTMRHPHYAVDELLQSSEVMHKVLKLLCGKLGVTNEELTEALTS